MYLGDFGYEERRLVSALLTIELAFGDSTLMIADDLGVRPPGRAHRPRAP
jgi:hypothetical protein